jgi:hypothetical protein
MSKWTIKEVRKEIADFFPVNGPLMVAAIDAEIARLQEAKRRALAVADERSRENVALRAELTLIADIAEASTTANSLPNIARIAREALK